MQQLAILLACTQSLGRWLRLLNGTMIRDYFSLHTYNNLPRLPTAPRRHYSAAAAILTQKQVKFMMVADVLLFLQHFHYYCVCIGLISSIMEFNVMANYLVLCQSIENKLNCSKCHITSPETRTDAFNLIIEILCFPINQKNKNKIKSTPAIHFKIIDKKLRVEPQRFPPKMNILNADLFSEI